MTRETQIGLTLVLVLCGVFGFFVYKKVSEPAAIAAVEPDAAKEPVTTPDEAGKPPAGSKDSKTSKSLPPIAAADDLLNVKTASVSREIPANATPGGPRIPVESKAQPLPENATGDPAPAIASARPDQPRLPTLIPGDEEVLGAPSQPAARTMIASSRPTGAMEVVSGVIPPEGDDPFGAEPSGGAPADSQPAPRTSAAAAGQDEFGFDPPSANPVRLNSPAAGETESDPFGGPVATPATRTSPKLPTITDDSFDPPARQPEPAESDPFGAPSSKSEMEAAGTPEPRTASAASEQFGFGDAPAANPVRLGQPVAEETESDPFAAAEPKTVEAAPASPGEPESENRPVARTTPALSLPTKIDDNAPDGFEAPVRLEQPEAAELTRTTASEVDPFGTATAESTTDVQSEMPAREVLSPQPEEPEFAPPKRVVNELDGGTQPRPAPTLPIDDGGELPAVRPAAPSRSLPGPVAMDLPQPGAITADRHVVEPNQNFWTLAKRKYGEGRYAEALAAHNKQTVPDPSAIKPGTIVSLPAAQALEQQYADLIPKAAAPQIDPASVVAGPGQYVIQDGDSFWKISKKVYGDPRYWDALQKHNSETSKLPTLKPGTVISTPPVAALEQKYASAITAPAPKPTAPAGIPVPKVAGSDALAGLFDAGDGQPLYRVGDGDTLSSIARSTLGRSSRWVQILHLNRETLKDGNDLTPGTVLRMPADASQVQMSSLERDRR